jgi:hypothetical protein
MRHVPDHVADARQRLEHGHMPCGGQRHGMSSCQTRPVAASAYRAAAFDRPAAGRRFIQQSQ